MSYKTLKSFMEICRLLNIDPTFENLNKVRKLIK
jgi:hypothetical protein